MTDGAKATIQPKLDCWGLPERVSPSVEQTKPPELTRRGRGLRELRRISPDLSVVDGPAPTQREMIDNEFVGLAFNLYGMQDQKS